MNIVKNVPLPESRNSGSKYPFNEMEIGDSVFLLGGSHKCKETDAAKKVGRRHGKKFVIRNEGDGIRIWRVA